MFDDSQLYWYFISSNIVYNTEILIFCYCILIRHFSSSFFDSVTICPFSSPAGEHPCCYCFLIVTYWYWHLTIRVLVTCYSLSHSISSKFIFVHCMKLQFKLYIFKIFQPLPHYYVLLKTPVLYCCEVLTALGDMSLREEISTT